ncbi:FMN reductase [Ktedonobacter sp. SOSP1-52]|uniref:NADPH-dependent FMN reductase n=1 Tax=Ktedonobacter sp. SOSP1-52 TaxID=2778366 RepID=UPI001916C0F1|nr:NAD(P)H-dependent oxidoreductase [Ktedonobacter sp. SOSP1-52]GHO64941.1 FMN reductase [Ktedonobacter sp. SOSP1-52]
MSIIRIVGFTGSLREESYNKAALRAAQELLPAQAELEILSLSDLPAFTETYNPPESVRLFSERIAQADALLIATPEYKGLLSNALKNALKWIAASGNAALAEKPVALMGIGRQRGPAHVQLRQLLATQKSDLLDEPSLYVGEGHAKIDAEGRLVDAGLREQLQQLLQTLVARVDDAKSALV